MRQYRLVVSTPEGNVFNDEVISLSLRGTEGDLAVLANHTPFITTVKPCQCKILLPDESLKTAQVESGMLTVAENQVTLLSDSFVWL